MRHLSWELIQAFAVLSEYGSISKASQHLGCSQPTLSRQLSQLEKQLDQSLFNRSSQGIELTPEGLTLIKTCQDMKALANQFELQARGQEQQLSGTVRISANELIATYRLPSIIQSLNQAHPQIQIEIDVNNSASSFSRRDTDIALRMFKPTQPDLVVKRLGNLEICFTASHDYLAKYGKPKTINELFDHVLIGFDKDDQIINQAKSMGICVQRENFINRTDSLVLQLELAKNGCGIMAVQKKIIQSMPELVCIELDVKIPDKEFWLVCHSDIQHNQRIRTVMNFLTNEIITPKG